jgi:hypothetical protein
VGLLFIVSACVLSCYFVCAEEKWESQLFKTAALDGRKKNFVPGAFLSTIAGHFTCRSYSKALLFCQAAFTLF